MRQALVYPITRYLMSTKLIPATQGRFGTRTLSLLLHPNRPRPATAIVSRFVFREEFLPVFQFQHLILRANMSLARQNFPEECEAGINRQINLELYASYVYSSMAYHFDRDDVALPGFHKFFKKQSDEERAHAEKLMKYQNMRGGRILLQDIRKPEVDEWGSGAEAMTSALKLEKSVNQSLLELHKVAESKNDVQMGDFLEGEFLKEQVHSIKQIADYVTQLNRAGPGLGEYQFDKETLQETD